MRGCMMYLWVDRATVDHITHTIFRSELTETARIGKQDASFGFVRGRHSTKGEGEAKLNSRPFPEIPRPTLSVSGLCIGPWAI